MRSLAPSPPVAVVAERLEVLRRRIADAGADPSAVTVVAVTKGFDRGAVDAALAVGIPAVGENYADELLAKAAAFGGDATVGPAVPWHYIGAIQRRRVRELAAVVQCWQTVWRLEEGRSIARHAPGATVMVEVNLAGSADRPGAAPTDVATLVQQLGGEGLSVVGLMGVAPPGPPQMARPGFRALASLAGELGLAQLSMGMSGDLQVAVEEGATMVRVGTALFGQRPPVAR